MKVEEKGHTITIRDTQGDVLAFLEKVTQQYNSFKNHNLILDLTKDETISVSVLSRFTSLAKQHQGEKKSFVLVVSDTDFNEIEEEVTVVPTLLEAHDIIEMEEIERDLGF